jgi:hypothetical protein
MSAHMSVSAITAHVSVEMHQFQFQPIPGIGIGKNWSELVKIFFEIG